MPRIVTLTTDFGLADGYVAAMKGVMLTICSDIVFVDITHQIEPQDVRGGAYVLGTAARRFPAGTIHLGVVDPGVGSARRAMVLVSGGHIFVGPDNGLFTSALGEDASAVEISASPEASATFHGRDLFAPIAARIAAGEDPLSLGPVLADPVRLPEWEKSRGASGVRGRVMHFDRFGNAITNLCPGDFDRHPDAFHVPGRDLVSGSDAGAPAIGRTYADVRRGEAVWLVGSEGFYELAVREGSARERFRLERGDTVIGVRREKG